MSRFIAIDWDNTQAYLIAGRLRGDQVEVQHALTWEEDEPPLSDPERAGQRLRDRLRDAGISPAPVLTCVGRDQIVVKEIRFPAVPESEEAAVVRFQAIKELADNPDDVVIDYFLRSEPGDSEKRAGAVAIRKKALEPHQKLCKAAGLQLIAVTPRLIGVMISLRKAMGMTVVTPPPEPPDGAYCVVVAGERQAEVAILKGDKFLLSRTAPGGPGLAAAVRQNLMVHAGQEPGNPVVAVYVTGTGTGELRERLGNLVGNLPVHTFDPFAGSESAVAQLPMGQRGLFSGPMGLLHMQGAGELPINFVSPRQPKQEANPNVARLRLAALVVVLLVVGLFLLGTVLTASANNDAQLFEDMRKEKENDLKQAQAKAALYKAIGNRDTVPILDELYDLAWRTDLKQVRVTKVELKALPPSTKSRYIAQMTIHGKTLPTSKSAKRQAYDTFALRFTREGYYSIDNTYSKFVDPNFTLVVNLERRAPSAYTAQIEDPMKIKDGAKKAGTTKSSRKSRRR